MMKCLRMEQNDFRLLSPEKVIIEDVVVCIFTVVNYFENPRKSLCILSVTVYA